MIAMLTPGTTGHDHVQKQVQGQGLIVHYVIVHCA